MSTPMDRSVIEYMVQRKWALDLKTERKRYLFRLARESKNDPDIASKIGGMLIYNQVIEQFLEDIVDMSIHYIKADLWPVQVEMDVGSDSATFGKVIDLFRQHALVCPDREEILSALRKFNSKRNQVVHDLFDIRDLHKLGQELDEYDDLAGTIIRLLLKYEESIDSKFRELELRVDFSKLL